MTKTEEIMELATVLGDRRLLAARGMNSKDDVAMSYEALKSSIEELVADAETIEANTSEACAKIVEQEAYPGGDDDDLIRPYNTMIKNLAEQIRRME